ncbi:hypothetical protein [Aliivibrio salmonicida]|uniref:hypothetical protein n=1 Tax=Aliivibrio salmonicida TaxID=40269 RepID=UPI003D0DB956
MNSNIVAIISVIVTALASGYATYSQSEANRIQQANVLELEKYKQENQLQIIQVNAQVDRFNDYCSKIEKAIKELNALQVESFLFKDDFNKVYKLKMKAMGLLYLLPIDKQNMVFDDMENGKKDIRSIYVRTHVEYQNCMSIKSS